jgi:hypothetical protein
MDKCPQNIDIIGQLRETVRTLDDAYGKLVVRVEPAELTHFARRDGRFDATLKCRLQCHNLSDSDLTPELSFSPPKPVTVSMPRGVGRLGPFGRRAVGLTIEARSLREGQPLRLGASLPGPTEMVFDHDPLPVAIARKASRRSPEMALAKAPLVRANTVRGDGRLSARAKASHGLAARFAYNADALIVDFDARGAFRRPTTARRPIRKSDNLWLNLRLDGARGIKVTKNAPNRFIIGFGIPDKGPQVMPVGVHRPRLPAEQVRTIRAEVEGGGQRRRALVRIPWKLLQVTPPGPGARLSANFGMTCWPARGRSASTLSWAPAGRGYVLFAK